MVLRTNFSLKKNIGSESSYDMSGHNTKTTTSNFRVDVQNKLATGLKGVPPYYSRLQTVTKPCFQMQSIAFAIIFFCQRTVRTIKYGVIRKYC